MRALACFFVFACVFAQSSVPVCQFTEDDFYDYGKVVDCFHSILLTDDIKLTTLATIRRSLELYAFYDIAHSSPDANLPLSVNMQKGLEAIENRPYFFDFDFHNDLRYLYLQLNDAHTQYYAPTCYQNMLIRQGFAPVGVGSTVDDYSIVISPYISSDLSDWYQTNQNILLSDYVGYTISAINGIDALEYFTDYAEHSIGMAKDPGARLNYALTMPEPRDDTPVIMYGYWQTRTHRNPFPQTSEIMYDLISPSGEEVQVILPWTFKSLKTYTGVESWLEDYYAPVYDDVQRENDVESENRIIDLQQRIMQLGNAAGEAESHKETLVREVYGLNADDMTFELLVNSSHLTFWELSDQKTMVMYLDSMGPGPLSGFYPSLVQGFTAAAERGLTNLIIDLSNNGGGNICLGRTLVAFLQQNLWPGQGQNWGPQDIPISPLATQLINAAVEYNVTNTVWSPAFYDNQENVPVLNNDTSFLLPGLPHYRGGYLRRYSKMVHIDGCGNPGYILSPAVDFSPENTLILTNAFCGSTCAVFSDHLAGYDGVRTVVTGGMPGRNQMQFNAFPGGQVMEKEPMFDSLAQLRQNITFVPYEDLDPTDVVPRRLATQADFRHCVREIYPPPPSPGRNPETYSENPMEFNFQEATYHMFNTNVTAVYPQYVWYDVLDLFD